MMSFVINVLINNPIKRITKMMTMRNLLFLLTITLLTACGQNSQEKQPEIEITKHGENISSEGAISAEEFLDSFSESDSMKVKFLAEIDEVCSKKGCWMTLNLDEERTILVRFKDYEFFVPKDAAGKTAVIEGFATIDTLSISEQKHYLSDANASQEEIDAVIEPEITYAFEATGVIIKGEK